MVITNPTHFAIALKYDDESMDAPIVVAKGTDFVAQKIKLIAKENDVVMVENRPLARAMYDQVEIGDEFQMNFSKQLQKFLLMYIELNKKFKGKDWRRKYMQIRDIGVLAAVIIDCSDARHPSSIIGY